MSEELAVIPKQELQRALGMARHRLITSLVLLGLATAGIASAVFSGGGVWRYLMGAVGGAICSTIAITAAVRAHRAKSTIQAKLAAQKLPAARLLGR